MTIGGRDGDSGDPSISTRRLSVYLRPPGQLNQWCTDHAFGDTLQFFCFVGVALGCAFPGFPLLNDHNRFEQRHRENAVDIATVRSNCMINIHIPQRRTLMTQSKFAKQWQRHRHIHHGTNGDPTTTQHLNKGDDDEQRGH